MAFVWQETPPTQTPLLGLRLMMMAQSLDALAEALLSGLRLITMAQSLDAPAEAPLSGLRLMMMT